MGAAGERKLTVALAGNPNVGKSTLFNALTGLRQHTGNWPGKTVELASGEFFRGDTLFTVVDLPGTYSLEGSSEDEQVAGEFIREGQADCTVVVCDGSCLERSLILALRVLQMTQKVVICVNLMDEATRRGFEIDGKKLQDCLQAPVVFTSAGKGIGLDLLIQKVQQVATQTEIRKIPDWNEIVPAAGEIAALCVKRSESKGEKYRRQIDKLMVSRRFGVPLMLLLLFGIVWITVWGANYPSELLEKLFWKGYEVLSQWLAVLPVWLRGILLDGVYSTSARVMSVMLPPMAIFFPLFTLLEDIGYLPRMAFLLDPCMARCGGCGKQALTLCMGIGCNAVGVMGCRIISCPRRRLAAILTNAMVPCNGRFPTLILLGSLFFAGIGGALAVAGCVALGAVGAVVVSGVLTGTVLRSGDRSFLMEMPPFRRPRLGKIFVRALLDRTLAIAGRTLKVAAPAGAILWLVANTPLLQWCINALNPIGIALGMNGVILFAFFLSLPANELLIPVILMSLSGVGSLREVTALSGELLLQSGMTWQIGICTMVFTLFHWPCATTLMTVYRETGSMKKTAAAFLLPTAVGVLLCMMLRLTFLAL